MGKPPDALYETLRERGLACRRRYRPWRLPLGEDRAASPLTRLCHLSWVLLMVTNDKRLMTNDQ
ncbi:hypothetical protein [Nostoc sp.]|uniref:hypothetical protein n=1 Tax=Nostoc sp. TaxID=1180 RepID=UPI002FF5C1EC